MGSSGKYAIACLARAGSAARSTPSTSIVPASGASRPATMRKVVVLPAPFGPSRAYSSPCRTVRSSWSTAGLPNCLERLRSRSAGSGGVMIVHQSNLKELMN